MTRARDDGPRYGFVSTVCISDWSVCSLMTAVPKSYASARAFRISTFPVASPLIAGAGAVAPMNRRYMMLPLATCRICWP